MLDFFTSVFDILFQKILGFFENWTILLFWKETNLRTDVLCLIRMADQVLIDDKIC